MNGYGPSGFEMGYGMVGLGWVFMVLVWLLLIAGVAAIVKWLFSSPSTQHHVVAHKERTAIDILEERFARGEIDKEEFDEKRRYLRENR